METSEVKKVTKTTAKKSSSTVVRISNDTKKKLIGELAKVNKKQFGKKVKLDALLLKMLTHLSLKDIAELQEESLTGRDRMEQSYREYCSKHGQISIDEYYAHILNLKSNKTEGKALENS